MADLPALSVPVDWKKGVLERWQWLTDVMLAWNGTEQRRQIRLVPRVELEAEALLAGTEIEDFIAWLDANQASIFALPYWPAGSAAGNSLTGQFLEPVELRWASPRLARASLKVRLAGNLPAPTATVRVYGGFDVIDELAPDFKRQRTDSWRRLLEVLDYLSGPVRTTDRSGAVRRRWAIDYLLAGNDEIQLARAFFWRRAGRLKLARFPAPEGNYAKARLDGDEIEWQWMSPQMCRISTGVLTMEGTDYIAVPPSPPVADFIITNSTVMPPLVVTLTDTSSGLIDSWSWDFGDFFGASTEQNPTYEYASPDAYSVTLTVTGPGGSDSKTLVVKYSQMSPYPICGAPPLAVVFDNVVVDSIYVATLGDLPANVSGLTWDFGDGGSSTAANPSHTYAALGIYNPTLTIHRMDGPDTLVHSLYPVTVANGVASNFTANGHSLSFSAGPPPVTVTLTNLSTGSIAALQWTLPDGSTSTAFNPDPYIIHSAGNYSFTLHLTNPCGNASSKTLSVTVTS